MSIWTQFVSNYSFNFKLHLIPKHHLHHNKPKYWNTWKFILQTLVWSLLTYRCQMRGIDRGSHFSFQNSVNIFIIQIHWKCIVQTSMWILLVFGSHTRRSLRGIPHLSFQIFILHLCEKVRQKTRTIIYYNLFVNLTDSKM